MFFPLFASSITDNSIWTTRGGWGGIVPASKYVKACSFFLTDSQWDGITAAAAAPTWCIGDARPGFGADPGAHLYRWGFLRGAIFAKHPPHKAKVSHRFIIVWLWPIAVVGGDRFSGEPSRCFRHILGPDFDLSQALQRTSWEGRKRGREEARRCLTLEVGTPQVRERTPGEN